MKLKASVFALAAMFMALALTGCYTQVAKKERSETRPEYSESTSEEPRDYQDEERDDRDYDRDYDRVTNVYVYDDFYYRRYYWDRWDPWYAWHYRSPRSGWYVRAGYYDYDYWDWSCGTRWSGYYDPWWDRYAYAGYGPRWGWYDPYWDHSSNVPRGRGHVNEKRPFGRRSSSNDDGGGVARRGSERGHLSKPEGTTYARGEDGIYRRTRRTDTESIRDTRTEGTGSSSDGRRSARRGASSDTRSEEVVSLPNNGGSSVARPAPTRETPAEAKEPSSSSDRRSSKRESSDNDKVSKGSSSKDSGSSSRKSSSGSSTSAPRRSSNSGNSGGSSSGVSRSGDSSSGSSAKGSSNSGGSSNNNSSSGSNRRSRN